MIEIVSKAESNQSKTNWVELKPVLFWFIRKSTLQFWVQMCEWDFFWETLIFLSIKSQYNKRTFKIGWLNNLNLDQLNNLNLDQLAVPKLDEPSRV